MQKNICMDIVKVSVIIPMYNCEDYIRRCVESLLRQTYDNIEVIVVDDGSKDNGASIVRQIQEKNEKVIYIYQDNGGPGKARNRAIKEATGKYILFVDADDYLGENYVNDLVAEAEKNESELIIAGYTLVYSDNRKMVPIVPERYAKNVQEEWAYRISACCSRLYLKKFWDKNGLEFSEDKDARAEDVPIAIYSNAMAKNISVIQNAEYFYYQHPGSAMNNKNKRVIFEFPYAAFENMYLKLKKMEIENSEHFLNFGILKFLAQFDLVIYRRASAEQKTKYINYLNRLIGKDFASMVHSWNRKKYRMDLPFMHKLAIEIFILKHKLCNRSR